MKRHNIALELIHEKLEVSLMKVILSGLVKRYGIMSIQGRQSSNLLDITIVEEFYEVRRNGWKDLVASIAENLTLLKLEKL